MKTWLIRSTLAFLLVSVASIPGRPSPQQSSPDPNEKAASSYGAVAPKSSPGDEKTVNDSKNKNVKPDDKIILGTHLVTVTVTVTDSYNRYVTGLRKDHFDVFDNKVKQQISLFSDEDAPISLGIVYDISGSMKERIQRSLRALRRFVETSHDDDDIFLIGFNERASLIQDFTTSTDRVLGHLTFVNPKGTTALYDASYLAVEKIKQGRHPKKAILIISDGQDNNSRYTYKELRNRVRETDVQIYAIGITDPATDALAGVGRSILEEITRMTGGRAFFPAAYNEAELIEICTRIALELRHQYAIGFYPSDLSNTEKWHKLHVKINPPRGLGRLSLNYREGYQSFSQ